MNVAAKKISVAFSGAPSVGKTTVANALAGKVPAPLKTVFSSDVARMLVQEGVRINLDSKIDDYLAFLAVRFGDVVRLSAHVVIYERTILDVLVFMQLNGDAHGWLDKLTKELVEWQLGQLSLYFYIPIEFEAKGDGVRITNPEINRKIDEITVQLLRRYWPNFVTLTGSIEERTQQAYKVLSKELEAK